MISRITALSALSLLLLVGFEASAAVTLVKGGKSSCRIVISTEAIPSERHAAEELQLYVRKVTGVTLPVVSDREKPSSAEILIGASCRLAKIGVGQKLSVGFPAGGLPRRDRLTVHCHCRFLRDYCLIPHFGPGCR